jgi:hypothetical protein
MDFQLLNTVREKIGTGRVLKARFLLHRELWPNFERFKHAR